MRPRNPTVEYVRVGDLVAIRVPRLFAHFFDVHFLAERDVRHFQQSALSEMSLAVRLALLLADELLIPAASYYESPLCRQVLRPYPSELFGGQISLVASGTNLDEFIEDKRIQYGKAQPQGLAYRSPRIRQPFPWRPRQRSATADIKSDWRGMLAAGQMERLFEIARTDLPLGHDRVFEALPDRLGSAAFIVPNTIPLLFEGKSAVPIPVENALHSIVNQAYFGSYAKDLGAAVFQNMHFLQSSTRVPSGDPDNDVDYRRLTRACRRREVLADIVASPVEHFHRLSDDPRFVAACVEASGVSDSGHLVGYVQAMRVPSQTDIPDVRPTPINALPKVLIVTALPLEAAAVRATFDGERVVGVDGDPHIYCVGTYEMAGDVSVHRDVLLVTQSDMGKANAATVAANALRSFPRIQYLIMVGIAGGCPNPEKPDEHVRLGDIVVSDETGIIEYDDIKATLDGTEYRGPAQRPSYAMLQAVRHLAAGLLMGRRPWEAHMDRALGRLEPNARYMRPPEESDILHNHAGGVVAHPTDLRQRRGHPAVHTGGIATADTLQKNPRVRDELRDRFRVRAIEMEGAGIQGAAWAMQRDVLVVRAICDYCDKYKNDTWQPCAAIAAAGYARALVEVLPKEWF